MNQNTDPPVFRGNILDLLLEDLPPKKNNIFPIEIIDSPVVVDFCGFPIWKIENHLVGSSIIKVVQSQAHLGGAQSSSAAYGYRKLPPWPTVFSGCETE